MMTPSACLGRKHRIHEKSPPSLVRFQDLQDCRDVVAVLVGRSLLQPVGSSGYRVHDLLLDFVKHGVKPTPPLAAVALRQAKYLGRLDVIQTYANSGCDTSIGGGYSLMGYFPLAALWRAVEEVSSDPRLQVDTYSSSLKSLGEGESEEAASVFWAVGSLLEFQVSAEPMGCICRGENGCW